MTNASVGMRREGCRHEAQTSQSSGPVAATHSQLDGKTGFLACYTWLAKQERTNSMMLSPHCNYYFPFSPTDGAKGQP